MAHTKDLKVVSVSVSDRYQTVIPYPIREILKIKCGDRVEYLVSNSGEVVIRKALSEKELRQAWLTKAFETYEAEDLWSDIKDEPFHE
ncbi:MAG: type II toxin-antitoxin system PrlF family antitoxin [Proteobacteria bacterium]|nr:type II toxin-antitoxin system PrlF family antitoxin [Pseudomonadota bacterium]